MSQIAEELSFTVLSVIKFENLEVSQEAKIAPSFSARPLCHATLSFGHKGCPRNAKKLPLLVQNFSKKNQNRQKQAQNLCQGA